MFGKHVHVHVHLDQVRALINRNHHELLAKIEELSIMNEESNRLLDQINTYTNDLATAGAVQAAKTQEISDDLDDLIATITDTSVRDRLQAHADGLAVIAANQKAQAETLTALAAKHDKPLPPPVPPPEPV